MPTSENDKPKRSVMYRYAQVKLRTDWYSTVTIMDIARPPNADGKPSNG